MYRFLLSPRWIAAILGILLAMSAMIWAGTWQLDRWHGKRAANAAIVAALDAEPVPAQGLIPRDAASPPDRSAEWRIVELTGHYLPEDTIVIRQRSFGEGMGFEVVVPFEATDGATYLLSRGFVPAPARADVVPDLPAPPSGEVTVDGRVRIAISAGETASTVQPIDGVGTVRSLDIPRLAETMSLPLAGGYIEVIDESGSSAAIDRVPLPPRDDGPHLSYAVQWFLFATITLAGLIYLIRREGQFYALADEEPDDAQDEPDEDGSGAEVAPARSASPTG